MNYRKHFSTRNTAQSQPIPGRESEMIENNAGGYGFKLSDWDRLNRFLIMGSDSGTFYVNEKKLTQDNAQVVSRCINEDGIRVVNEIIRISDKGLSAKNDPAIFALAMCAGLGNEKTKKAALNALPKVCRIGTHLFHFAEYVEGFRGWGRSLRRAISNWYDEKTIDQLVIQVSKYRQRDSWSHRDLLRLSHPKTNDESRKAIYDWICGRQNENIPTFLKVVDEVATITDNEQLAGMIKQYRLPREVLPTNSLNSEIVWKALLDDMPLTAMIRNLGKMSAIGLLNMWSDAETKIVYALTDENLLQKSRIHPLAILIALKTYEQGYGEKGKLSWKANQKVIKSLDSAFYKTYKNITPTNQRILVGVDISRSMNDSCNGIPMKAYEAAAAVASVIINTEPNANVIAFDTKIHEVNVSSGQRLDDFIRAFAALGGGTNLTATIDHALKNKINVDAFILITDNETWAGSRHSNQALEEYRQTINPKTKLIVLATTANHVSVVDPIDPLSLGIAGFDASVMDIITAFLQ